MVCLLCDFKILLTVFNQSYNCQTSHYLGRNRLPKPFLILPSLLLLYLFLPLDMCGFLSHRFDTPYRYYLHSQEGAFTGFHSSMIADCSKKEFELCNVSFLIFRYCMPTLVFRINNTIYLLIFVRH